MTECLNVSNLCANDENLPVRSQIAVRYKYFLMLIILLIGICLIAIYAVYNIQNVSSPGITEQSNTIQITEKYFDNDLNATEPDATESALITTAEADWNEDSVCITDNCMQTSINILQNSDFTVDPCDDFYKYTCGNFFEGISYNPFYKVNADILEKIRRFLVAKNKPNESNAVIGSRTMYTACLREYQMDKLGLDPAIYYLRLFQLPSYPSILNELSVDEAIKPGQKFDWIKSIAMIKRHLGLDILIGFNIISNPIDQTENLINLGKPKETTLTINAHVKKILEKMVDDKLFEDDDSVEDYLFNFLNTGNQKNSVEMKFMGQAMSKFAAYSNPSNSFESTSLLIDEAIKTLGKVATTIFGMEKKAQNTTMKYMEYTENERLFLTLNELQNATDGELSKPMPIWDKYLNIIFANNSNAPNDLHLRKILTSKVDVYYIKTLFQYIETLPEAELELFVWWSVVEQMMMHTTSDIRKMYTNYFTHGMAWYRTFYCGLYVNELMPMATAHAVIDPNFWVDGKPTVDNMLGNIRKVFDGLVRNVQWMDVESKRKTLEKSAAMKKFIGYSEWILNGTLLDQYYDGLKLNAGTHLANMINALKWSMDFQLNLLHQPQPLEYLVPATAINAFYVSDRNTIIVPIAILQHPMWNLGLEALNYGRMGMILAHEWTHAFDNIGRIYDKNGNMKQWWTNETIIEYNNRSSCFVKQYNDYLVTETFEYIDGERTLAENLADNAGLRVAFDAYQLHIKEHGREQRLLGLKLFTHEQLFFLSFGNLWCTTSEQVRLQKSLKDTHSPGMYRVNGAVSNFPEFSKAFHCTPGSRMYPVDECRIW